LSELLVEVAGEPVQDEVSAVRVLFELLGFLLKGQYSVLSTKLSVLLNLHLRDQFGSVHCGAAVLTGLLGSDYN
jgi:hypothetical protein